MQPKNEKKVLKNKVNKVKTDINVKSSKDAGFVDETAAKSPQLLKKQKTKKSAKKVKTPQQAKYKNVPGKIPKSYSNDCIVGVKNLPEKWKQSDIISAFTKFGSLTYVQKTSSKNASIAFLEPEAADAAKESRRIFVKGQKVIVKNCGNRSQLNENKDQLGPRTVLVSRVDANATEKDVKTHFKLCGEIESIRLLKKKLNSCFEITFVNESSVVAAIKLHNTVLKDTNIHVRRKVNEQLSMDSKRTIVLLNPDKLTKIEGTKIEKPFVACGEIEKCDVFCYKNRLAMLTFKNENSVTKALSLNGTTKYGFKIEVELLSTKVEKQAIPVQSNNPASVDLLKKSKKSKISIEKVAEGITEADLANLFKTCGEVESVELLKDNSATVKFKSAQGYCKAFSLHECSFGGKRLILKPHSEHEMPNLEEYNSPKIGKVGKRNFMNSDNAPQPTKLRKKA